MRASWPLCVEGNQGTETSSPISHGHEVLTPDLRFTTAAAPFLTESQGCFRLVLRCLKVQHYKMNGSKEGLWVERTEKTNGWWWDQVVGMESKSLGGQKSASFWSILPAEERASFPTTRAAQSRTELPLGQSEPHYKRCASSQDLLSLSSRRGLLVWAGLWSACRVCVCSSGRGNVETRGQCPDPGHHCPGISPGPSIKPGLRHKMGAVREAR